MRTTLPTFDRGILSFNCTARSPTGEFCRLINAALEYRRAAQGQGGGDRHFRPFDVKFIGHVATRIINEVTGINHVVYDVTSKPSGTIGWE